MSDEIRRLLDGMLDREFELNPPSATFAGIHDLDDRWDDASPAGVDAFRSFVAEYRKRLTAAATEAQGEDAVDLTVALSRLARYDVSLDLTQDWRRNPLGVPATVVNTIFIMMVRDYAPTPERMVAALSRLEKVPAYVAGGLKCYDKPVERFTALAVELCDQGAPFLSSVLPAFAERHAPTVAARIKEAGAKAAQALQQYAAAVKALPQAGDFAAGREAFDRLLKDHYLLGHDADSLLAFGRDELEKTEAEMAALADKIRPGASAIELIEEFKKDHPPADGVLDFYKYWMERSRQFVVENDLCGVPEGEELEIIPTPEFERGVIPYAAYMPPAPYEKKQKGFFYVTPVEGTASPEEQAQKLAGHNRVKVPVVALHEGYPGHHLQLCWANKVPTRIRREAGDTPLIEGWALYCEEMMREKGFYPDERAVLGQKRDTLWRAVRVVVDVSLHTRGMPFADAVSFLMEKVNMERVNAEAEVKRYIYTPTQPMSYLAGKHEILKLRDEFFRKKPRARLREFHDRLLAQGSLPIKLVAAGVLS